MKQTILATTIIFLSSTALADDNNITNSNNTNYATTTQSNEITHNDSYITDNHSQDSSQQTDNSIGDNRNNTNFGNTGSYNQANQSTTNQDINNSVTKTIGGDLNENSNNNNIGNANNIGANAGGDNSSHSTATGGQGGDSRSVSASTVSNTGNSTNNVGTLSTSRSDVNGSGNSKNAQKVVVQNNQSYRQVHQAPGLGAIFGQVSQNNFSCASSVGLNFSFLLGGFGFTLPWSNDRCELLVAAGQLNNLFGYSAACHLMHDNDDQFRNAMNRAAVSCDPIVVHAPTLVSSTYTPPRLPDANHPFFDQAHKAAMQK